MNKKIFIDSDIILDIICCREPYYQYAAYVFSLSDTKKIVLYIKKGFRDTKGKGIIKKIETVS